MIARIVLYIIATWLIAAHFLRVGSLIPTVLCMLTPLLFFVRRRWSLLLLQWLAYAASIIWLAAGWQIVTMRRSFGQPLAACRRHPGHCRRYQRSGWPPSAQRYFAGALSRPMNGRNRPAPVDEETRSRAATALPSLHRSN